jgi:hypothetical protein
MWGQRDLTEGEGVLEDEWIGEYAIFEKRAKSRQGS